MINSVITTTYKYPLLPQKKYKVKGYYKVILDAIAEQFEYMIAKHSQVLLVRLHIRFPVEINASGDNSCFQHFIENYTRYLKSQSKLKDCSKRKYIDPHYVWSREHSYGSHNQHYHLLLLLSRNGIRYFSGLETCENYWANSLYEYYRYQGNHKGLIHFSKNIIQQTNGMIIYRDNQASFYSAFELASYISKVSTKENTPFNVNIFSASRIPNQLKQEVK